MILDNGNKLTDSMAEKLARMLGLLPLTPEEATELYDESEPVPLSEERIREMVDHATSRSQ
jgi:hypothetical protein